MFIYVYERYRCIYIITFMYNNKGDDQKRLGQAYTKLLEQRDETRKMNGGKLMTEISGTNYEKSVDIEQHSQVTVYNNKINIEKHKHNHLLNETETTIRYSIFILTLMYFRSMSLIHREKRSWSDGGKILGYVVTLIY